MLLDFSDHTRTGISKLIAAVPIPIVCCSCENHGELKTKNKSKILFAISITAVTLVASLFNGQ